MMRWWKVVKEALLDEIPFVGEVLDHKMHGDRKRKRAKSAPKGWVTVDAVVEHVEAEKTGLRVGEHDGDHGDEVFQTTITYSVIGEGAALELRVAQELVSTEIPEQGSTWKIAYDPSKTDQVVLLTA